MVVKLLDLTNSLVKVLTRNGNKMITPGQVQDKLAIQFFLYTYNSKIFVL